MRSSPPCACLASLLVLCSVVFGPVAASAQTDGVAEQARVFFNQGLALADRGDWASAVDRFEHALALRDAPSIRLNLALSLSHLGRLTDTLAQLEAFDRGPAPAELGAQAAALRAEVEPRVGRLVIRVRGAAAECRVEAGLRTISLELAGEPLAVDPGTTRVRLLCGDRIADEVEISVPEGGVAHVVLAPEPDDARGVSAGAVAPPSPQPADVTSEAWFWAVLGVGAAALIAGATVGVVLATQPSGTAGDFDVPTLRFELRP